MKVIMEFELPEEEGALRRAMDADNLVFILWDLDQWLRDEVKYHDNHDVQPVRNKLHEILEDHGIILSALI